MQETSPDDLRQAFQTALDAGTFGVEYIDHYLDRNGRDGAHA